jgi:FHA domain
MQQRYALRFESGERRGEAVAIPAGGLSLGRRPGNGVQVVDSSVSGRHAELELREGEVWLRDLGSTNGTRVAGERISERRLAHGDEVLLGSVKLTFIDRQIGEPAPVEGGLVLEDLGDAPAAGVPASDAGSEELVEIDAADMKRSRGRPSWALAGVALILAAGAAAWWWLARKAPGQSARTVQPVVDVTGNLLAKGYSFENEHGGWESDERSPAGFEVDSSARHSGAEGLRAELGDGGGDWALAHSELVELRGARALSAKAWMRADEGSEGVLGLHLESSSGAASPLWVWSAPVAAGNELDVELASAVPPVFDRARALVLARLTGSGSGGLDVDDVSLVAAPAAGAPLSVDEFEVQALGAPPRAVSVVKIARALLSLELCEGSTAIPTPRSELLATLDGPRVKLLPPPPPPGASRTLAIVAEPALAALGVASTGADGYQVHQTEFERAGARAVLLGSGRDLVRIDFGREATLSGRPEGGGFRLEAQVGAGGELALQLAFREERAAAQGLAANARRAEAEGRMGEALATWKRVVDEVPYESALLTEAGESRARIEQAGLAELASVRVRLERARFFRLVDVYRRCRDGARSVAQGFAPSAVADEGQALLSEIESELGVLERDLDQAERERLVGIEAALRAEGAEKLAARVHERIEQRFGGAQQEGH